MRPTIAFSFDDGFASNVETARVLEDFGTTGCYFVPTAFVGTRSVAEARDFYGTSKGVDEPALTWNDLERLVARGHEIGNHTVRHRVLSEIGEDESLTEIKGARDVLRERLGQGAHFAWPKGRFSHSTPAVVKAVFESGHTSCASAERGVHNEVATSKLPCLRRDHLMTSWPKRHNLHFVNRSPVTDGSWPFDWEQQ